MNQTRLFEEAKNAVFINMGSFADIWRFLIVLIVLNFGLGAQIASQARKPMESKKIVVAADREPASRPTVEARLLTATDEKPTEDSTVTLKCLEKQPEIQLLSKTRVVRILGEWCKPKSVSQVSIENRSSGLGTMVFQLSENRFSTEYLDLQKGTNVLLVKGSDAQGRSLISEIQITY